MNKVFYLCVLLVVTAGCVFGQSTEQLWKVVSDQIDTYNVDNMYVLIGDARGTVYEYDKGTTTNNTQLVVASATKWITSVVIQHLLEEEILNLWTRPQEIIPWWTSDPADARSRVTVQHLLTFQSGFNEQSACLDDSSIELEECAKAIYDIGIDTEPGSAFYYNGNHMQILGFMAQNKTGLRWNTLFANYVKTPLNLLMSYAFIGKNNPRLAGGLTSSVLDYAKVVRGLFLKTILQPETIDRMEQDYTNVTIVSSPADSAGVGWHYALGHWVECDAPTWEERCATEMHIRSSAGAFGFYPWLDRKQNYYGIMATTQSTGATSAQFISSLRPDIENALASMPLPPDFTPATTSPSSPSTSPSSGPSMSPSSSPVSSSSIASVELAAVVLTVVLGFF